MKIHTFLKGSLLSLAVFLSACGSSNSLEEPLTREYNTYIGEFKSIGSIRVSELVTHLFENDAGDILYAYSTRYDLDETLNIKMEAYGVVTTYENLDKPLFEVKRLSEFVEEDSENEEVTTELYKNSALGVSFKVPSDWTLRSEDAMGSVFEAPVSEETPQADQAEFVKLSAGLTRSSDDTETLRAQEVQDYVLAHFPELARVDGDLTYVGTDRVLGVRYVTESGDVFLFVPRGSDLFKLHFIYLSENDTLRLNNTNTFTGMVASFRFIPEGESDDGTGESDTSEGGEEPSDSAPTAEQVNVSKWATLSSATFAFSMEIPAAWYYIGGSTGYVFALESIEDVNAEGVVRLEFNNSTTEGVTRGASGVVMTRKVDSRYYTLTGSLEYETVMQTMLDSIQTTKTE